MITENGWPSCGPELLDRSPIPGTSIVIPLQRGIPSRIMKAFAADFHAYVESLYNARGGTDEGGWTPTNSVATSNHLGGTAMDLNWSDHPMGKAYDGYTQAEITAVRELLAFYEGMMFWGNDWNSPKDSMHFQMGYNTYNNQAKCNDFIKRKIRADGFSTFRRGGTGGGTTPAPTPIENIYAQLGDNNDRVRSLQQFMNDNFGSYSKLDVDGDFGPLTEKVIMEFQRRVQVADDGIVGPVTLAKLVEHGYVPLGAITTPPPAPAGFAYPSSDEMVKQVWEQLFGPQAKGWPALLGKVDDGSRGKYVVEAIADLHKAAS
ncbi:peptidase-M15-4 domain-containing protein [Mycobacterium phage mika]|uniref:Lysin A n=1 Tax=Mycobacterium phage Babsiella TaxID=2902842 RepID=G8I6Q9_9CAUD|nr:endolysin [Mycobacterium phage Babsiella]AER48403.1 lysin A [Mycobacterium phage Babsiella]WRQ08796.1 peptidase-M15-4 domain-containing protein [Mycobacterium phage mika]WRQ08961.1 peptidase-M15-4 domain-containing protein [Mycobacterium phage ridax]